MLRLARLLWVCYYREALERRTWGPLTPLLGSLFLKLQAAIDPLSRDEVLPLSRGGALLRFSVSFIPFTPPLPDSILLVCTDLSSVDYRSTRREECTGGGISTEL